MSTFNHWKNLYDNDNLEAFNQDASALLWLKIKSIARKELLLEFLRLNNIVLISKKISEQFEELYNYFTTSSTISHQQLDSFLKQKNTIQQNNLDTNNLVSELYKMRYFDWGGDYKNNLDKYLVDKYIKAYPNYDVLISKLDREINRAVQGYVLCSWYNHWSSILIEHLFKSHHMVLPTVGQIKKVDFFITNIPFDLKVTYLPANFIEQKRKEKGFRSELSTLKTQAKLANIIFSNHSKADDTYYEIVEKMKDKGDKICLEALQEIKQIRLDILEEVRQNPTILIQNLYEQQGELRFDASNRLFWVLVDTQDFDNSWKLKRNLDLLNPSIQQYLDEFSKKNIADLKINFTYKSKNQSYTALSDIIFIIK